MGDSALFITQSRKMNCFRPSSSSNEREMGTSYLHVVDDE